jgi:hypothetical protein
MTPIGINWAPVWQPVWKAVWAQAAVTPAVVRPPGGWVSDLPARRRRTREELMRERIELGMFPEPAVEALIEALPEATQVKVKKAGTITLRALLGTERAEALSTVELELELAAIQHRARLRAEDELLLLM